MVRKRFCSKKLPNIHPIRVKLEQLALKIAPDSRSGRLGVIRNFKTWLENVSVAKSYQIPVQLGRIGAICIVKCSRLAFWTSRSHWGFKTWLENVSAAKCYQIPIQLG